MAGGGRALLNLVLEVVLADDLDVHPVLAGDVALLLEQDRRIPEIGGEKIEKGLRRRACTASTLSV